MSTRILTILGIGKKRAAQKPIIRGRSFSVTSDRLQIFNRTIQRIDGDWMMNVPESRTCVPIDTHSHNSAINTIKRQIAKHGDAKAAIHFIIIDATTALMLFSGGTIDFDSFREVRLTKSYVIVPAFIVDREYHLAIRADDPERQDTYACLDKAGRPIKGHQLVTTSAAS